MTEEHQATRTQAGRRPVPVHPRLRHAIALCSGLSLGAAGLVMVAAYITEAIIGTAGEPDRSPLFWYLPILFLGLMLFVAGLIMGGWGILPLMRQRRRNDAERDSGAHR